MDEKNLRRIERNLLRRGYSNQQINKFIRIQRNIDNLQYIVDHSDYEFSDHNFSLTLISINGHDNFQALVSIDSSSEIKQILKTLQPGIKKLIRYYKFEKQAILDDHPDPETSQ